MGTNSTMVAGPNVWSAAGGSSRPSLPPIRRSSIRPCLLNSVMICASATPYARHAAHHASRILLLLRRRSLAILVVHGGGGIGMGRRIEAVGGGAEEEDGGGAGHDGEGDADAPADILLDVADGSDGDGDADGHGEEPPVEEGAAGCALLVVARVELLGAERQAAWLVESMSEGDEAKITCAKEGRQAAAAHAGSEDATRKNYPSLPLKKTVRFFSFSHPSHRVSLLLLTSPSPPLLLAIEADSAAVEDSDYATANSAAARVYLPSAATTRSTPPPPTSASPPPPGRRGRLRRHARLPPPPPPSRPPPPPRASAAEADAEANAAPPLRPTPLASVYDMWGPLISGTIIHTVIAPSLEPSVLATSSPRNRHTSHRLDILRASLPKIPKSSSPRRRRWAVFLPPRRRAVFLPRRPAVAATPSPPATPNRRRRRRRRLLRIDSFGPSPPELGDSGGYEARRHQSYPDLPSCPLDPGSQCTHSPATKSAERQPPEVAR
uniref:Uncharacterized protein n=1 Tax=Oryza meridionalis TaxID=40149 RepID=A0A0E0CE81_9ORYZ